MAGLESKWKRIDPVHPLKYDFFDQQLAEESQGVFDVVSILGFIAMLAVIIACLGMLGMATYSTERRRKEVGIRKVLGSARAQLFAQFLSEAALIVLLAALLAVGICTITLPWLNAILDMHIDRQFLMPSPY